MQPKHKSIFAKQNTELKMNVQTVKLTELTPDPKNTRRHDRRNIEVIKESLGKFGQFRAFVVQKQGMIIRVGNGMYQAMMELGWTEADAEIKELKNEEAIALSILDNRSAELAQWDEALLSEALKGMDETLSGLTGFDDKELNKIISFEYEKLDAKPQTEIADELQEKWKVEPGQIWQLGNHRIACGNSSDETLVKKLMDGEKASCMFTDPPYGVSIGDKNAMLNAFVKGGRCQVNIEADTLNPEELKKVLLKVFTCARQNALADSCAVYVCAPLGGNQGVMMLTMMAEAGLEVRHVLNWVKNSPTFSLGRLDYEYQHEPIFYTWNKKHECFKKGKFRTTLWNADKHQKCDSHPTMKPVELYTNAYLDSTRSGDVVYEPFSGSGTAIIAAEELGLKCRAIEITPRFVAVALQRFFDATGKEPKLIC